MSVRAKDQQLRVSGNVDQGVERGAALSDQLWHRVRVHAQDGFDPSRQGRARDLLPLPLLGRRPQLTHRAVPRVGDVDTETPPTGQFVRPAQRHCGPVRQVEANRDPPGPLLSRGCASRRDDCGCSSPAGEGSTIDRPARVVGSRSRWWLV
jgi:hypothetical protein